MNDLFDPQVGERCHWTIYSDVEPCTVVHRTAKTVKVRIDKADLVSPPKMVPGGFAAVVVEPATWSIRENPAGRLLTFSRRSTGRWKLQGTGSNERGNTLQPGWHKYYDYGF